MGNQSTLENTIAINLHTTQGGQRSARLTFWLGEPGRFSLVLLDEKGREMLSKVWELKEGSHQLEFPVKDIPGGSYHAWLHTRGKTFIRQLHLPERKQRWYSFFKKCRWNHESRTQSQRPACSCEFRFFNIVVCSGL